MSERHIRLGSSYWLHDSTVPFSEDIQPGSIFLKNPHYLVLDIETQKLAQEVGGWGHTDKLGVSVACAYDSKTSSFLTYREEDLPALNKLCKERLIVGYNVLKFDLKVLSAYGFDSRKLDVFDLMLDIEQASGNRRYVKLDNVAKATLGSIKIADGLQAVEWYRQGNFEKIIEYCLKDVEITRDVFLHGMKNGFVNISRVDGSVQKVTVQWN